MQILEKTWHFSKLTIKIQKEAICFRSGVFVTNSDQSEINVKGDDDFATKTVSMKNVEGKSSGLNKKCEK